jgi:hypothetical protein
VEGTISTVIVTVLVIGALYRFCFMPAGPIHGRRKPSSQIGSWVAYLSTSVDGSTLTVRHDATGRTFSFVKEPDDGQVAQTVGLVVSETEWSSEAFESLNGVLQGAPFLAAMRVDRASPDRVLIGYMTGQEKTIKVLADQLAAQLLPALDIDNRDTFTFRQDGRRNHALGRRAYVDLNPGLLEARAAQDPRWLGRVIARSWLGKLHAEKRDWQLRRQRRKHLDEAEFEHLRSEVKRDAESNREEKGSAGTAG